jgi:GTPase SAR1 family protein
MMEYDHLVNVLMLGSYAQGQKTLVKRYVDKDFNEENSYGMDDVRTSSTSHVAGRNVKIQLAQFAGEAYGYSRSSTLNEYMNKKAFIPNAIVLCYDVTDQTSFNNLRVWLREIDDRFSERPPIVLAAMNCDLKDERVVDTAMGKNFAQDNNLAYIETNNKPGQNVKKLIDDHAVKEVLSIKGHVKENDKNDVDALFDIIDDEIAIKKVKASNRFKSRFKDLCDHRKELISEIRKSVSEILKGVDELTPEHKKEITTILLEARNKAQKGHVNGNILAKIGLTSSRTVKTIDNCIAKLCDSALLDKGEVDEMRKDMEIEKEQDYKMSR